MKVFLVRHGQTTANAERIYSGQSDVALTELGRQQAREIVPVLAQYKFDRVYSSDLKRAADTQKLALPGYQAVYTPLLREVNVGQMEGKSFDYVLEGASEAFWNNRDYSLVGGESDQQFLDRVRQFMQLLEKEPCEYVAAFAHNGVLNCFLQNVLGATIIKGSVVNNNCAINVFEYTQGKWKLISLNYMGRIE